MLRFPFRWKNLWYGLVLLLAACDFINVKEEPQVREQLSILEEVDTLIVRNRLKVQLHQADSARLVITGAENLISNLKAEIKEKRLTLDYEHKGLGINPADELQIDVYLPQLSNIQFLGHGNLSSEDTLHFSHLLIEVYRAYGTIDLLLENKYLKVVSNSSTNIKLKGATDTFVCAYSYNDGLLNARDFNAQNVRLYHRGENSIHLTAFRSLKGTLWNIGDIYYYGNPHKIQINKTGTGELIGR